MPAVAPPNISYEDAWIDGEEGARWRSAPGHGPAHGASASGSSLLEVEPRCHLPRHTDSAEETIVVVNGTAHVHVGDETLSISRGGVALIPAGVPHEVRNGGTDVLRFVAVYAATEVVTTYEQPVQPDGSREREPVS